jgi:hypothetical protein
VICIDSTSVSFTLYIKYTIFLEGFSSFTRLLKGSMAQKLRTPALDKITTPPPRYQEISSQKLMKFRTHEDNGRKKTTVRVTFVSTTGPE